jgi:hypothetical protein
MIPRHNTPSTPRRPLTMSYGSYSASSPTDIPSQRSAYHNSYLDESGAFSNWSRRVLLREHGNQQHRATSYIPDEDLLFLSEPILTEDDAQSISRCDSGTTSPRHTPVRHIGGAEHWIPHQRVATPRSLKKKSRLCFLAANSAGMIMMSIPAKYLAMSTAVSTCSPKHSIPS